MEQKIITVGFSPCWDVTCLANQIDWQRHAKLESQNIVAAGKALNVCRALAWMDTKSTAAGFWGDDLDIMLKREKKLARTVDFRLIESEIPTRHNITVVDNSRKREMHMRVPVAGYTKKDFTKLEKNIQSFVNAGDICVFNGSMPQGPQFKNCEKIIDLCYEKGALLVVDTSGENLKKILKKGRLWFIKPNLNEIRSITNKKIKNDPPEIAKFAKTLLEKARTILISLGAEGVILVSKEQIIKATPQVDQEKIVNTVGCGDFAVAGFLKSAFQTHLPEIALETAVKAGTARAMGLDKSQSWQNAKKSIKIKTENIII